MVDHETPRKASARLWTAAAAGAVMLHAACVALALAYMEPDDSDDDAGALAIEVGFEFAAPRVPDNDLPPGPEAEASEAAPEVMAQKEVVEQNDAPKEVPVEAEEPDQVVSPNDPKEVVEEEQKVPVIEAVPAVASVASEATAPPSSEVIPEGPRSVAPAQGVGQSDRRIRLTWQKELMAHLNRYKRYPNERSGKTAEIVVSFSLDRTGHIMASGIVRSSGDSVFDEAALSMLKRSNPVPAPPPLVADEGLSFTLPIMFRVKK
jgi:periplasmic protein TonB